MVRNFNELKSLSQVSQMIGEDKILVIAAEEKLLSQLPKGKWIGATESYFYLKNKKGVFNESKLFVSDFTNLVEEITIATYTTKELNNTTTKGYTNGFNFLYLPALSDIHLSFALNAPKFEKLYNNPLIGLIAGTALEDFSNGKKPKVFNGMSGKKYDNEGIVLHAKINDSKVARLEIINVFEPSEITLEVEKTSFSFSDCLINGKKTNLYDYIIENNVDIKHPIVTDYSGATINISFQRLEEESKEVVFYAPLFKGTKYTFAKPLDNYAKSFIDKVENAQIDSNNLVYNCNCILNYLYGELEQNDIGFSGPTTFGEIAYNLLNQTFTYLVIE